MHSTRIATFLLGAWMACCLLMDFGSLHLMKFREPFLRAPIMPAAQVLQTLDPEKTRQMLDHFAGEQVRSILRSWEAIQIALGLLAFAAVFSAVDRRIFPMMLTSLMLVIVLLQFVALSPEIVFRGRESDFPQPGITTNPSAGLDMMYALYGGADAIKLVLGAILVTYLFSYKSRKRKSKIQSAEELAREAALRNPAAPVVSPKI